MKNYIYQVCVVDPYEGNCISWFTTRREAEAALEKHAEAAEACYINEIQLERVTLQGFVDFLNHHVTRDNG